jgi:hypothetical protein
VVSKAQSGGFLHETPRETQSFAFKSDPSLQFRAQRCAWVINILFLRLTETFPLKFLSRICSTKLGFASARINAQPSPDFHGIIACDREGRLDFVGHALEMFAIYSQKAFLNKKQGISPIHPNLIQRLSPQYLTDER